MHWKLHHRHFAKSRDSHFTTAPGKQIQGSRFLGLIQLSPTRNPLLISTWTSKAKGSKAITP